MMKSKLLEIVVKFEIMYQKFTLILLRFNEKLITLRTIDEED